ncbi:MAG TPA: hypothetical protein VF683_10030, partial [Chthoniobacterales bacterium]
MEEFDPQKSQELRRVEPVGTGKQLGARHCGTPAQDSQTFSTYPLMPIDLNSPLRWKTADSAQQKLLRNLQGNILKGHGRDQTWNIFFKLGGDVARSKRGLREIGNFHVTSAYEQLLATEAFKEEKVDGGTFCAAFLTATGYQAIAMPFPPMPDNKAFAEGMKTPSAANNLA